MDPKEMLVPLDLMVPLATVEHLDHLDLMVQLEHRVRKEQLEDQVYQAPGELSVLRDQLDCRVSQDHLEPQDHQEGKELLDQSVTPVFKGRQEKEALRVKPEFQDQQELED